VRNNAKELALLSLYMQRTQRAYERYRNDLKQMQEERKARHAQELEQARMLYQLAEAEGQDYDPQQDGFVFSLPELKAAMDLFHRGVKAKRRHPLAKGEHLLEFPPLTKKRRNLARKCLDERLTACPGATSVSKSGRTRRRGPLPPETKPRNWV
jgi:hypothetical protein